VLGANNVEDLMMLIKDRLITPKEMEGVQKAKVGQDE
jgi:hypothetical protein